LTVWSAHIVFPYDGSEMIGVFSNREKAKERALAVVVDEKMQPETPWVETSENNWHLEGASDLENYVLIREHEIDSPPAHIMGDKATWENLDELRAFAREV
jgi:hypothetical protein